jgi:hypothetical protein
VFLSGPGTVVAQEWLWTDAAEVLPPTVVEIAGDPSGGMVYALDDSGNVQIIDPTTGGLTPFAAESDGANDIAVGYAGQVYICTNDAIRYYDPSESDFEDLPQQPILPTCPGGIFVSAAFTSISVGDDGKLYVVYELFCEIEGDSPTEVKHQYILTAEPPVITEGVVIDINPNTLNLRSRGRWVTCRIDLPEGLDESDIDIDSIQITNISVLGMDYSLWPPIERAQGSPWGVQDDGRLMVKFIRYDKNGPRNAQSLVYNIWDILEEESPGFYQVTVTVTGMVNDTGLYFQGNDTFRVKKGKKPPKGL